MVLHTCGSVHSSAERSVGAVPRERDGLIVSGRESITNVKARGVHLLCAMDERAYWHTKTDALIASAAQALEAKGYLARYFGCSWEYVDENLPEVLVTTLRRLPGPELLRRESDKQILSWVARLVPEVPNDHPQRLSIHKLLREKLLPTG